MALRANLSPPRIEHDAWPWHHAKWTALSSSLLFSGDRRMEAENYLAGGYGIRLAMEARKIGLVYLNQLAKAWQPSRLKGIQVSPEFGTPFLAATQVFDLRPVPRKFLSLDRTDNADKRFVHNGMILVTCSGSVGRSTMAHYPHQNILISHDLLRVVPRKQKYWGWLYAYLRTSRVRSMMTASQYGHIIKHLEVSHLDSLPIPLLKDHLLDNFSKLSQKILDCRNRAYELHTEAERLYGQSFGIMNIKDNGEAGFAIRASDGLFGNRRRFDALPHNPVVKSIYDHLMKSAQGFTTLIDENYKVWLPSRFKRIPAKEGIGLLDSSDLFEINPDILKKIVPVNAGDRYNAYVKKGWLLLARSGQIYGINGTLTLATEAHEQYIVSDHIIRIASPQKTNLRAGYLLVALSHPELGRPIMKSLPYGSSIPEIDVSDVEQVKIARLKLSVENAIANLAEEASELNAKADILENDLAHKADSLLDQFIQGDSKYFVD